jgi:hypothetical protein
MRMETAVLIVLSVALAATAFRSLSWRLNGDEAVMLYAALLQRDFGLTLYRDIFDMNAPGAHAVYRCIVALAGNRDTALRLLDLGLVLALSASTAWALRPFGRRAAWAAAVLPALLYLGSGDTLSLQREFFVLLPIAWLLWALTRPGPLRRVVGPSLPAALLAGVCVGAASAIKPQAGLLALVILPAAFDLRHDWSRLLRLCAAAGTGLAIVWAFVAGWLWCTGALAPFAEMASRYWPLYDALTGRPYGVVSGWERVIYLAGGYANDLAGRRAFWVLAAVAGLVWFRATADAERARAARPIVALAAVTLLFPGVGGKFWEYHWLPFGYALMVLTSLALADGVFRPRWRGAPVAILLIAALGLPLRAWTDLPTRRNDELTRVDRFAAYLAGHLREGDTVQPLDWTGTALHAMLLERARVATPFLEDVHFYHHADDPYVQGLKDSLMRRLESARPRFILQVDQRGWVPAPDSRHPFPELGVLLSRDYEISADGPDWIIYERRTRP